MRGGPFGWCSMRNKNPREMSDKCLSILLAEDFCPMCLGELDTGYECNDCGYDAIEDARRFELDAIKKAGRSAGGAA